MVVKCSQRLHDLALQKKKVLGRQTDPHANFTYFIAQYVPDAFKVANVKYKPDLQAVIDDNNKRSDGRKQFAHVVGTEFSIDNKIQHDLITSPNPHEVIHAMTEESEKLAAINFTTVDSVRVDGSTFQGFAVWLQYASTVYLAYIKARICVPDADHIMLAYNIPEGASSCDDGESFGDLQIAKALQQKDVHDIAIFITRKKGQKNLGSRHFQVIRNMAYDLINKITSTRCDPVDRGWLSWPDDSPPTPVFDPDDPANQRMMASLEERLLPPTPVAQMGVASRSPPPTTDDEDEMQT